MIRRQLLAAALVSALAAPATTAHACDITKLKVAIGDCSDFWSSSYLLFMQGYCDMGYLMFCDLL